MSTYSVLPNGKQFLAIETNGKAGTLTVRHFETKVTAREWIANGWPMGGETICWRDGMPPEEVGSRAKSKRSARSCARSTANAKRMFRAISRRSDNILAPNSYR
jgi:hypothetical protein